MSNLDIFERELVGRNGETKKINEIINISKHTWQTASGNIVMKHEAILLLRKFTGARFLKPELQKEISNPGNVVYLCIVEFPDGEISYEIGESNNGNTVGWSRDIKSTMAFKRGHDRAFLRSDYIGLFEVFSEEESEDFKQPHPPVQNLNSQAEQQQTQLNQAGVQQISESSNTNATGQVEINPALFLPSTDAKYPGKHIIEDVLKQHKDFDYLYQIPVLYPTNDEYIETVTIIREQRESILITKQKEAEAFLDSNKENAILNTENATTNSEFLSESVKEPSEGKIEHPLPTNNILSDSHVLDAETFLNSIDDSSNKETILDGTVAENQSDEE